MRTHRSWTTASVFAGAVLLAGPAAPAADSYSGTIGADTQKVTFTHGFAWTAKPLEISVGLYRADPNEKEQARARARGGAYFGVFDAPNALLDLTFKEGSTQASLASFESCHILFAQFDAGIYDWNAFKPGCGAVEFSGDLKAGGVVHGKLKGRADAYPRKDGTIPVYTWDVDFTTTLHAAAR